MADLEINVSTGEVTIGPVFPDTPGPPPPPPRTGPLKHSAPAHFSFRYPDRIKAVPPDAD